MFHGDFLVHSQLPENRIGKRILTMNKNVAPYVKAMRGIGVEVWWVRCILTTCSLYQRLFGHFFFFFFHLKKKL